MGYYALMKDMEENRCKGCMFFIDSKRWGRKICGASAEMKRNCEEQHKGYVQYVYGGNR